MIMKTAEKLSARPAGAKRICLILCLAAASFAQPPVQAQDNGGAAELGRLFFSPAQRQELDRRRALNIQEAIVTVESLYTVNGHVARSSGKSTTWVNGAAQNETYKTRNPAVIPLQPTEDTPPVDLRVGQTLDRNTGNIHKIIGVGEITIKPGAAPARR